MRSFPWLVEAVRPWCRPCRWHRRVCYRPRCNDCIYALAGFHWLLQLGLWLQHRWALAANATSILERWISRQLDPCRRGHSFTVPVRDNRGDYIATAEYRCCLRCGAPNPKFIP